MVKTLWILLGCFFNHGKDPFLSFSSTKGGTLHKIEEPYIGFMFLLSFSSQMNHPYQQILGVLYVGVRTFNGAVLWIWVLCLITTSQRTLLPWTTIVLTNVRWFFFFFFWVRTSSTYFLIIFKNLIDCLKKTLWKKLLNHFLCQFLQI